jgi:hypothetical protein
MCYGGCDCARCNPPEPKPVVRKAKSQRARKRLKHKQLRQAVRAAEVYRLGCFSTLDDQVISRIAYLLTQLTKSLSQIEQEP